MIRLLVATICRLGWCFRPRRRLDAATIMARNMRKAAGDDKVDAVVVKLQVLLDRGSVLAGEIDGSSVRMRKSSESLRRGQRFGLR